VIVVRRDAVATVAVQVQTDAGERDMQVGGHLDECRLVRDSASFVIGEHPVEGIEQGELGHPISSFACHAAYPEADKSPLQP